VTDPDFGRLLDGWPGPEFHVTVPIRAPLDFAYRWCTHYTPEDPGIEGGAFHRKVLLQRPDRAEFEDLEETRTGWVWSRSLVTFYPPRGWALLERGNRVEAAATYLLTERPGGTLRFDLRWRRRTLVPPLVRLTKAQREKGSTVAWQRFARALERDYRRERREHPVAPSRSRPRRTKTA
jgi:hypothetical protein